MDGTNAKLRVGHRVALPNPQALLSPWPTNILTASTNIKEVFSHADFDAQRFRRRFRQVLTTGCSVMAARGLLHRTDDAKDAFAEAERMASLGDGTVFPLHLLYALLAAKDPTRDEVQTELSRDNRRILDAARRAITRPQGPAAASTNKD